MKKIFCYFVFVFLIIGCQNNTQPPIKLQDFKDDISVKELEIVGFIICMREGCAYQSKNYKFFTKRLKKFLYVDRIAIDINHRREGLGKSIYADIFNLAKIESLPIALEVNIEPINQPSLDFHEKLGFDRIGEKKFVDHSVAYFLK